MKNKYDLGKEVKFSADGLPEAIRHEVDSGNLSINDLSKIQLSLSMIWGLITKSL